MLDFMRLGCAVPKVKVGDVLASNSTVGSLIRDSRKKILLQ